MTSADLDPFELIETTPGSWSLVLRESDFTIHTEVFEAAGAEGNGYDWASIALTLVDRDAEHLVGRFGTDPEAGAFVAYGADPVVLTELGELLREAYNDADLLAELAAIAEWE